MSALVRLADPGDEATSECCAAALYLFFCHPAVLALIDGREVSCSAFILHVYDEGGGGKARRFHLEYEDCIWKTKKGV